MSDSERWPTLVGFGAAVLVLAALLALVGAEDVITEFQKARPSVVLAVVVAATVWLSAWGLALQAVLGAMGVRIGPLRAIGVFTGAMFANNVTPFGQAGGEPVSALLISKATDCEYETGLAAIASIDVLHFMPSIGFAIVGLGVFGTRVVAGDQNLVAGLVAVTVLCLGFVLAAVAGWRYRYEIERQAERVVPGVVRRIVGIVPRVTPPSRANVRRRIGRFFDSIDRVASDPATLVRASVLSAIGWFALSMSLWLSLVAIGTTVPVVAVLVVIPLASILGMTPFPGGTGPVESGTVGLILSLTAASPAAATAAVVIHRGITYWGTTLAGWTITTLVGVRRGIA
ncbi:lysylphosphatidylglycerol synthase transmembrane domain-containing protein [Halococcoides cellulosivorans]|uniref:TIGR00374 family protein n=1 Tax=Halococcoides cellulosivorans TaxID=1679096 RepID=A0A2R4X1S1_9EURY|nr:lysylphosphatidylglycerol synthase transmembrane domain-containing protein [Halococcoides cellulosivorans]AWB27752.1 TIGR00374 family protein [Halococcoides cellulosivorans]